MASKRNNDSTRRSPPSTTGPSGSTSTTGTSGSTSSAISSIGSWTQALAVTWLVLDITNRADRLGLWGGSGPDVIPVCRRVDPYPSRPLDIGQQPQPVTLRCGSQRVDRHGDIHSGHELDTDLGIANLRRQNTEKRTRRAAPESRRRPPVRRRARRDIDCGPVSAPATTSSLYANQMRSTQPSGTMSCRVSSCVSTPPVAPALRRFGQTHHVDFASVVGPPPTRSFS